MQCENIMLRTRFRVNPHSIVAWMSGTIECGFSLKRVLDIRK